MPIHTDPDPKQWYFYTQREIINVVPLKSLLNLDSFRFFALQLLLGLLQAGRLVGQHQAHFIRLIFSDSAHAPFLSKLSAQLGELAGGVCLSAGQLGILSIERVNLETQLCQRFGSCLLLSLNRKKISASVLLAVFWVLDYKLETFRSGSSFGSRFFLKQKVVEIISMLVYLRTHLEL